ncbi:hypothetical protein MMC29_000025 [Sticta canariensis]|nr:hypothetical protein [Sticta canariensis]
MSAVRLHAVLCLLVPFDPGWRATHRQSLKFEMCAGSRDTCVWALTVLPDGSMASGDSAGMLAFWDASFGTQLCSFKHQADILAVAASPAGDAVFASGIDSRVCMYKHMPVADKPVFMCEAPASLAAWRHSALAACALRFSRLMGPAESWAQPASAEPDCWCVRAGQQQGAWQFLEAKRPHTHDVRTLTVVGAADSALQLLSAGADARLQLSSVPRFQQVRHWPSTSGTDFGPSSGKAHDGPSGRVAAMQHGRIDIWDLGTSAPPAQRPCIAQLSELSCQQGMQEGCALELASQPVHVASFSSDSSHGRHHPHTASLSHDGSLLAWADSSSSSPCLASICHCDDSASLGACYRAAHAADPDQVEASPAAGSGGWSIQRHDCRLRGARSIARVAFAGNACLLTACHDGEVLVTNLLSSRVRCSSFPFPGVFALLSSLHVPDLS